MAILGKGSTITLTPSGGTGTDLLANLCLHDIGDVGFSQGTIDATCHGSSMYRKFIAGMKDLDQFDVTVDYKDKATTEAIWNATGSHTAVITIPENATTTTTLTLSVVIVAVKNSFPTEDVIRTTISLKPDGITLPTWATTP